jgi:hypothetical protein
VPEGGRETAYVLSHVGVHVFHLDIPALQLIGGRPMICGVWREIASTIDLCYVPVFFGVVIGGLVLGFAELLAAGPYRDYMAKKVMTSEERQQLDQHLHDTGRAWIVAGRRLWLRPLPFAFIFLFGWPIASPTFCETIRCGKSILDTRGFIGLPCNKPRSILFGKVGDFSQSARWIACHS